MPPDRNTPTGTSAIMRRATASRRRASSWSADSAPAISARTPLDVLQPRSPTSSTRFARRRRPRSCRESGCSPVEAWRRRRGCSADPVSSRNGGTRSRARLIRGDDSSAIRRLASSDPKANCRPRAVVEGLLADAIACEREPSLVVIPDRKGEHPVRSIQRGALPTLQSR